MTTVESIRSLDEECTNLSEESTQVWSHLMEDAKLQAIEHRLQAMQEKVQEFKEIINTLPTTKQMTAIVENRPLYLEIN